MCTTWKHWRRALITLQAALVCRVDANSTPHSQGGDGAKAPGFPARHNSQAHSGAILYDIDGDGRQDVGLALYDGEIVFTSPSGQLLEAYTLRVPSLAVQRDWHLGLSADPLDHTQPDVGEAPTADAAAAAGGAVSFGVARRRRLMQAAEQGWVSDDTYYETDDSGASLDPYHFASASSDGTGGGASHLSFKGGAGVDYALMGTDNEFGWGGGDDYTRPGSLPPGVEEPRGGAGVLLVDPHVLCTPTLADLDGDGTPELVVAVSYFFDKERYADPSKRATLPPDIVLSNYLATGLVVFDLARRDIRWKLHLDLSTDAAQFKAFAYSAPAAADVDMDGKLEVFVGTSVGFVYSFTADGVLRPAYPLQLGEVQASPGLADLDGDGAVELIVADTRGNVACFDALTAAERWERHLASMAAQGPTFADVDADGVLDVILGTSDGRVHALHGATGADVGAFPFRTGGRVMAPIMPLPSTPQRRLTLVAPSFDGLVYFIDASTGCADFFDVGEIIYGSALADDVDRDGRTEIVLATMNGACMHVALCVRACMLLTHATVAHCCTGNVLCLSTPWEHHPLMAWVAQVPDGNAAVRAGWCVSVLFVLCVGGP